MASIQEVVQVLATRSGVDAVIVLGRDGLTIDARAAPELDTESLAALVPPVADACSNLGSAGLRGHFFTAVMEYDTGLAIVAEITDESLLVVLVKPDTNVGKLLYELRRHRSAIADLL
ncbi:MAG: roadblock/LC7 domain-containing protein [Gemmatimonadales bacterium]